MQIYFKTDKDKFIQFYNEQRLRLRGQKPATRKPNVKRRR